MWKLYIIIVANNQTLSFIPTFKDESECIRKKYYYQEMFDGRIDHGVGLMC